MAHYNERIEKEDKKVRISDLYLRKLFIKRLAEIATAKNMSTSFLLERVFDHFIKIRRK